MVCERVISYQWLDHSAIACTYVITHICYAAQYIQTNRIFRPKDIHVICIYTHTSRLEINCIIA